MVDNSVLLNIINEMLCDTVTVATEITSAKIGFDYSRGYETVSFIYYYKTKPGQLSIDGSGNTSYSVPLTTYRAKLIEKLLN